MISLFQATSLAQNKAAQQSVQPTWGTRRVFKPFSWLQVGSSKAALSCPTHLPLTRAVSQFRDIQFLVPGRRSTWNVTLETSLYNIRWSEAEDHYCFCTGVLAIINCGSKPLNRFLTIARDGSGFT